MTFLDKFFWIHWSYPETYACYLSIVNCVVAAIAILLWNYNTYAIGMIVVILVYLYLRLTYTGSYNRELLKVPPKQ